MPPATTYAPLPSPHTSQPQSQPTTPASDQYSQQTAAKRPKLQPQYPSLSTSVSPISPGVYYQPTTPVPHQTYTMASAPTSMMPPPPPSQQQGGMGGNSGGSGGGSQPVKATDTNELADALASAGIDLKEEEAHLSMPINNSIPGLNPIESMNIRRDAEMKANHASNPFINTRVLQTRIRTKAREHNMNLGVPQGNLGVQQGLGTVSQDITTFLSLAMRERLHGLMTRSIVLARQRRVGNGMISGEWGAFVKGGDKHQSTINGDGGASGSPLTQNPLKRSFSTFSNSVNPLSARRPHTQTTTSIANETARALRLLAQQELQAETQRLQLKTQKTANTPNVAPTNGNDNTAPGASPAPDAGPSQPPTPGGDSMAPDTPKKLSAKETRKNQDIRVQEAVAHRAANSTAAMMMGLGGAFGGKKKKKYAWMMTGTPGAASPSTPGGSGGLARGAGAGGAGVDGGGAGGVTEALSVWGKRIGEWREDGEKGLGVQIRDWAGALEGDGREKRAIVRAYLKMK